MLRAANESVELVEIMYGCRGRGERVRTIEAKEIDREQGRGRERERAPLFLCGYEDVLGGLCD